MFKGIVNLKKVNKDTNEVTFEQDYKNVCTESLLTSWFKSGQPLINCGICMSEDPIVPNHRGIAAIPSGFSLIRENFSDTAYKTLIEDITGTYIEFYAIFDAVGYARRIQTVLLIPAFGDITKVYTYLNLVYPCEQQENELLKVTYRVYFPEICTVESANNDFVREVLIARNTSNNHANYNNIYTNSPLNTLSYFKYDFPSKGLLGETLFPFAFNGTAPLSAVGAAFKSSISNVFMPIEGTTSSSYLPLMSKIFETTSEGIVQKVYRKNNNSTVPFQEHILKLFDDADIEVTVNNTYNDDESPFIYKIEPVAGSPPEYSFKRRPFLGFRDNVYRERAQMLSHTISTRRFTHLTDQTKRFDLSRTTNLQKLSESEILLFNPTEFAIQNVITDDTIMFNHYTTNITGWDAISNKATVYIDPASPHLTITSGPTDIANNDPIKIYGPVPSPLVAGTTYYIRDLSGTTFNLAATAGGVAITLSTTDVSGDIYIEDVLDFKQATEGFTSSLGKTFLLADGRRRGGLYAVDYDDLSAVTITKISAVTEFTYPIRGVFKLNDKIWVAYKDPLTTGGGFVISTTITGSWNPLSGIGVSWSTTLGDMGFGANPSAFIASAANGSWGNINSIKVSDNATHIGYSYLAGTYGNDIVFGFINIATGVLSTATVVGDASNISRMFGGVFNYYDLTTTYFIYKTTIPSDYVDNSTTIRIVRRSLSSPGSYNSYGLDGCSTSLLVGFRQGSDYHILDTASYKINPLASSSSAIYYNKIYHMNIHSATPSFTLISEEDGIFTNHVNGTLTAHYGRHNPIYMGNGRLFSVTAMHRSVQNVVFIYTTTSLLPIPNYDPTHGIFEDLIWTNYGWTGSAWDSNVVGTKEVHNTPEELNNGVFVSFPNTASEYNPGTAGKTYLIYTCSGFIMTNEETIIPTEFPIMLTDNEYVINTGTVPSIGNQKFRNTPVGSSSNAGYFKNGKGFAVGSYISDIPFVSQTGFTCTFNGTTNQVLTNIPHQFQTGDAVYFIKGVGAILPSPLLENTIYYVDTYNSSTITLKTASNVPIDLDDSFSGTFTLFGAYQTLSFKMMSEVGNFNFKTSSTLGHSASITVAVNQTTGKWNISQTVSPSVTGFSKSYVSTISTKIFTANEESDPVDVISLRYNYITNSVDVIIEQTTNGTTVKETFNCPLPVTYKTFFPMWIESASNGVYDQKLSLPYFPNPIIKVGDGSATGAYDVDFMRIENKHTNINDYVTIDNNTTSLIRNVGAFPTNLQEVYIAPGTGMLVFHADATTLDYESKVLCVKTT